MCKLYISFGILVTVLYLNLVLAAEDWNGILCYADTQTNQKLCGSCVTVYTDDSLIKRDCYESLTSSEQQACQSSNDVKCHHCFEPFCNQGHPKHKCVTCNSTTDKKCYTNTTSFEPKQCVDESNKLDDFYCYTNYNKTTGDNERGCITTSKSYSDCMHNNETCQLCIANASNACNVDEFPANRRKCIKCDSAYDQCPTPERPDLVSQYSVYCQNVNDSCVLINRGGSNNFNQICASEMGDDEKRYCDNNQGRCYFCTGGNNCNLMNSNETITTTTNQPTTTVTDNIQVDKEIGSSKTCSGHQFCSNAISLAICMLISITMT